MTKRRVLVVALLVLIAGQAGTRAAPERTRPRWIRNGLIDAGGTHEPYIFVVRRGGQRLDARQQLDRQQGEETLRRLKQQGVEVYHTHLYKGFGMAAEMPEMEETKRVAAIAHRIGLKVDTYIQWNSLMYETFFAEEPRARNWIQRDANGRPIMLVYGYQQSFRYRPDFANQEYLDYLKKVVRYAVEDVKTDFIHFDNFDLNPEPESCHDRVCTLGFRRFLRDKYTPEQRRERFGFENVDYVNPPEWNAGNPPGSLRIIFDPVIQEWIDYRCQVMADALRQMSEYARSLNPEVAVEINPHGITGGNRTWTEAIDHSRLLPWTDAFWTESDPVPRYESDGRLLSRIRSYKLARAYHNILLAEIGDSPLAMSEALAFGQTLGFAGVDPLTAGARRYIAFYKKNRELFAGSEEVAPVAVLRSYASLTYDHAQVQLATILAEQALIQSRIPFNLVFDDQLAGLSKYRVLVLPETECLSDAQLSVIRKFVADGGGLVAVGRAGWYDRWRRLRVEPGLKGLVDSQPPARDYEEEVAPAERTGASARKSFEKGRVAYLPAMVFDGPLPEYHKFFEIDERFWKLPKNAAAFTDAVRWAAQADMPVEVAGPPYLVANVVQQPARRRMMIHLVNYDVKNKPTVDGVRVTCHAPKGETVKRASVVSPDEAVPRTLDVHPSAAGLTFAVPVKTYSIAVVEW